MTNINHKFFREKFYEYTNKKFDIVSTIDHPYASPPVRLIDGHNRLKILNDRGLKPLICIWDVNSPNINNYRYELALDIGILSSKNKNFFIFTDEFLYPLQKPKLIDLQELKRRIRLVLEKLDNFPKKLKIFRDKKFIENFERIADVYTETINKSGNGTIFYKNVIKNLYNLIGLSGLADFTANCFQSYFAGPISQEWIPYCIRETKDEPYGFFNLLKTGLFKEPYFRSVIFNDEIVPLDKGETDKTLDLIRRGTLIPSYQIFFWTLFLADIKHFGNDYGFFNRLKDVVKKYNFYAPEDIQLTEHNRDSIDVIQFQKDLSFSCSSGNGNPIIKKNNPTKGSRISSIPAVYCHLGDNFNKILIDIFEERVESPKIIEMGTIYDKK